MTATESFPKTWLKESTSVYRASQDPFILDQVDLAFLVRAAEASPLGRARVCAHFKNEDAVHEMIIALSGRSYIRPHRHLGKSESYHLISGEMDIVLFDDFGKVQRCILMSSLPGLGQAYLRFNGPTYHTMVLRSSSVVFHEVTSGPIDAARTLYAPWSPEESKTVEALTYIEKLRNQILEHNRGEV